jgi:flagellar basal body rod protein FlgG
MLADVNVYTLYIANYNNFETISQKLANGSTAAFQMMCIAFDTLEEQPL